MSGIRNVDIELGQNLLPWAGILYALYWSLHLVLIIFKKLTESEQACITSVTFIKGGILIAGNALLYYFLEKKTIVNFFYITGMLFFLIYTIGELLIEFSIYVIVPVISSIPLLKSLPEYLFYEGKINRRQMKILFIVIAYSAVLAVLLQQILGARM
ncbi:MAG: hypothetical protein OEV66_04715 [Spirochaetia bacterium]|nr:hypothetical protein [Spirochaetia bacterium]